LIYHKLRDGVDNKYLLDQIKQSNGKTGLLAISPVLRMNKKDIWKLSLLE